MHVDLSQTNDGYWVLWLALDGCLVKLLSKRMCAGGMGDTSTPKVPFRQHCQSIGKLHCSLGELQRLYIECQCCSRTERKGNTCAVCPFFKKNSESTFAADALLLFALKAC